MRRVLWFLAAILVAMTALVTVPAARSAGSDIAPDVADTVPARGEELSLDGTVTFYFNQPMDRASVETALVVSPATKGALIWPNESTATFKPTAQLQRSTSYSFTIGSGAKSKTGTPIKDTMTLKLSTAGSLEVSQIIPATGSKDVEAAPIITVIFNRPVVPLLPVEQMAQLPSPITLEPSASGQGQWLNTSIYTFKPDPALKGGTTYRVTVKKGLTDITNSVLQNDVVATFTTLSPRVIEILPENKALKVLRDKTISVTFSQPMDTAATESAFMLTAAGGKPLAGTFTWNDKKQTITFKAAALLDYGGLYDIKIDRTKARSASGAALDKDASASFTTVAAPDIISTRPGNGENADPFGGFQFNFSSPMKLTDFAKRVTVDPKPGLTFADYGDDDQFSYTVNFSTEPSTNYTVTINIDGLVDVYGTPLKPDPQSKLYKIVAPNTLQIQYTTKAYGPEASLKTGGVLGLYSAYRPSTRVYSTHRNIDQIDLSLWSLSTNELFLLSSRGSSDSYKPPADKLLRRWTMPVANPTNVLRYDLLTISDQGPSTGQPGNVSCLGAPPSLLSVGDKVVITKDDPTPLRIRGAAGLNAAILTQAKPGAEFTVVGGPLCADNFVWWTLTSKDGKVTGWAAEGDQQHYFIARSVASAATQSSPAAATQPAQQVPSLQPGLYWLEFASPQLPEASRRITHIMVVATANITLKVTPNGALAWVTDLQSGQPVSSVTVQFLAGPGQNIAPVGMAKTDANGLARYDFKNKVATYGADQEDVYAVVQDGNAFGIGVSSMTDGINTYDFGQTPENDPLDVTVYLYSDRSLYRPGQPVYYRGVLRSRNDVTYTMSAIKTVPVQVLDDKGQLIYQKDAAVNDFGTFADSFTIDPNAPLGYYRIVVRPGFKPTGDQKADQNYSGPEFSRSFSVAQYRTPEFQVKVSTDQAQVVQGEKIKVTVDSTFFFGGAVNNAKVEWYVRNSDFFLPYKGSGAYNFYDYNEDEGYRAAGEPSNNLVANGTSTTDAQGKFTIEIPADLGKAKQSQTFQIEAQVTDESGQLVSGVADVVVHQGEFYIGAVAEDYVGTASKPLKIDLVTVGWDSKAKPNTDLSIRLVERKWNSVQTVAPETGATVWNYDVKETPITDGTARTDADGKAVYEFTPPHGGVYKVYATSRDSRGNQITTSAFVWVAGPDYVPWRQQNSNRIDLKIDRSNYKIGDTASILIASPFQGEARALVSVERGGLLKTEVITLTNNSTVYKLPITPDMAPNAYVSVVIVKGVDEKNPVAAFRMGLVQLGVESDRLKLNISVTPDKPQAGPREKVTYKLHVTDYQGKPVQAEIGAGLTDLAVLSLMPDTSSPILKHFYSEQGLAVRTASTLTISVDQQTQEILNTVKGGGGGGPEGGIFEVRQEFVDTPLWQPSIKTDANGDASVTVDLPDQLTTWRLDARAVTQPAGELVTTLVGQTTFDLISTKPLLVRPLTPRFYVVGDSGTMAAVVNNNTDQPQDVKASIQVKGATLKGDANQTATIPAKGRERFDWQVEVQNPGAVDVTFLAATADNKYTDAAKSAVGQGDDKTLPVVQYEAPETVSTGGTIGKDGGQTAEGILLPQRLNITQGTLSIRVDPSLAASTTNALTALKNYPYQSTEQIISRFLPNLMTYRALQKLNLANPDLQASLNKLGSEALQSLYAQQHVDGGWGWFVQDDSNVLVTAYAVIALSEARGQGFTVDKATLDKAVQFIQKNLNDIPDQASTRDLNRASFLLYALSRADAGNVSRTVRLFQVRDKMSNYARAYLALTFYKLDPKNTRYTDPLLSDLQSRAITSATGQHWQEDFDDWVNWNTNTRSTAIVLKALVDIQPNSPLIPNIVRWLLVARQADAWETTQETAWAVMALTDWMQVTGELKPNYTFGVAINDKALANDQKVTPETVRQSANLQVAVSSLLADQVNKLTITRSGGDGVLYYTAHLTAYLPVEQIKPLNRGLSITRTYSLMNDPTHKPITQAQVGDTIRVTLTIVAPNDINYAIITDAIPAGAESVNPDLATSGSVGQQPELNFKDPLLRGWGWWWFSKTEFRDDRTVLYATYLPKGTYEYTYTLRAGLAGQYRVIPATGQAAYFPDLYGRSDGLIFTLTPAPASK